MQHTEDTPFKTYLINEIIIMHLQHTPAVDIYETVCVSHITCLCNALSMGEPNVHSSYSAWVRGRRREIQLLAHLW